MRALVLFLFSVSAFAQWEPHFNARMGMIALEAPLLGPGRMVLVGDSNTESFWWSTINGCNIFNTGIGGAASGDIAARAQFISDTLKPKIVQLMIGNNDVVQNVPPATTEANIKTTIQIFQTGGAKVVVWLATPMVGRDTTAWNQAIANAANSTGAQYDWWWVTTLGQQHFASDGIHLSPQGQISRYYRIDAWRQYLGTGC